MMDDVVSEEEPDEQKSEGADTTPEKPDPKKLTKAHSSHMTHAQSLCLLVLQSILSRCCASV